MKEQKPLISVVVPAYNVEKYLPKCVESLLNQTWKNLEIILVDDGSPDNCWNIMQDYARRDSRVKPLHQKNGGLSAARNAGVDAAKGEYIGFLDGDDYLAPETYELLYGAMQKYDAQIAVCSFEYVDESGKVLPTSSPMTREEVLTREEAVNRLGKDKNWYYVTAPNRLYRRELFDKVRFPIGKVHEDEYTAHLFYWQCERVAVVPRNLYYYVQHGNGIMGNTSVRKTMNYVDAVLNRMEFAAQHGLTALAFSCCNGALGRLVGLKYGESSGEPEAKTGYEQILQRMRPKIHQLLKLRASPIDKAKVMLFLTSPRLFYELLQVRNRRLEKKKQGA